MSIEKFRRVIWRLEELSLKVVKLKQLRKAIMLEIGTDEATIKRNIMAMIDLRFIKRLNRWEYKLMVGSHETV